MSTGDEPEGSAVKKSDLLRLELDVTDGNCMIKKTGLAKLAKARNISDQSSPTSDYGTQLEGQLNTTTLSSPSNSYTEVSSLRGLSKQSTGVTLLPNKMSVSSLSQESSSGGDQRRSQDSSPGTEITVSDYSKNQVPCSDPELVRNSKNRSSMKAARVLGIDNNSPCLSRRSRLEPPKVKRSNSLTHLTSAINQMHNMCMFAAQPATEEVSHSQSHNESSKSSEKLPGGIISEVIDHSILLPLMATNATRTDQSGRPKSWDGKDDECSSGISSSDCLHSETSPLSGHRSASMDELSSISGLPPILPTDAKQKSLFARGFSITRNYLMGGLGSLLGASELDRYFPNRTMNIFIATWNMNGKEPPAGLEEFLLPDQMEQVPDMYVIGTQESGGDRSEWEIRLQGTIGPSHVLFSSTVLGVLHLTIYLRRDLLWFCSVPEDASYSLRPGTYWKTKGCVAIGFQFFGTRMLFISSHLTAHEEKQAQRIQNFKSITQSLDLPRALPTRQKHKSVIHRYDCTFWMGDLNFRLAVNRDHVLERLQNADADTYQHLLQWDQLSQARLKGEAFKEFEEGRITFPPTFKYDPGTDHYDSSSKQRVPSFTDRILYRCSRNGINCIRYDSCPLFRTSDHKPVFGIFTCRIRPGKDDVPLAAGLFNRDVYLEALRRRRRTFTGGSSKGCPVQ